MITISNYLHKVNKYFLFLLPVPHFPTLKMEVLVQAASCRSGGQESCLVLLPVFMPLWGLTALPLQVTANALTWVVHTRALLPDISFFVYFPLRRGSEEPPEGHSHRHRGLSPHLFCGLLRSFGGSHCYDAVLPAGQEQPSSSGLSVCRLGGSHLCSNHWLFMCSVDQVSGSPTASQHEKPQRARNCSAGIFRK